MSNLTKLLVQFSIIEENIAEFIHCWLFQLPLRVIWAPQSRLPHGIYSMKNSAQANIGCVPSGSPYIFFHCFAGINPFSSCLFQNLLDSSCMDECLDPQFFATWFIFSELKCGIVAFQKKGFVPLVFHSFPFQGNCMYFWSTEVVATRRAIRYFRIIILVWYKFEVSTTWEALI